MLRRKRFAFADKIGLASRLLFIFLASIMLGSIYRVSAEVSGHNEVVTVTPDVETEPVRGRDDSADDPVIWIHPTDPSLSTVIGTDKQPGKPGESGGLVVYDLTGRELQFLSFGGANNVDLRYNFPLGGRPVDLVVTGNKRYKSIVTYRVNPETRQLEDVTVREKGIFIDMGIYGTCLYRSPKTGKYYAFMTKRPHDANDGEVQQWELFDDGTGKIDGKKVRTFYVGSEAEGCVADDVHGHLYVAQTAEGIWRYGAEPEDGDRRVQVADFDDSGYLHRGLEGLTIYYTSDHEGYLIVSQQSQDTFVIFRREGNNEYVGTFQIGPGDGIDGVEEADGISVTNVSLGPQFPEGLFVAHDGINTEANTDTPASGTNYKLVPWDSIANAFSPPLTIDTGWDPRLVGSPSAPIPSPAPSATPEMPTATSEPTQPPATASPTVLPSTPATVETTPDPAPTGTPTSRGGGETPEPDTQPSQLWMPVITRP